MVLPVPLGAWIRTRASLIRQRQAGGVQHMLPAGIERCVEHEHPERPGDLRVRMDADFGPAFARMDRGRLAAGENQMDDVAIVDHPAAAVFRHLAIERDGAVRRFRQGPRLDDADPKARFGRLRHAQAAEHPVEIPPKLRVLGEDADDLPIDGVATRGGRSGQAACAFPASA